MVAAHHPGHQGYPTTDWPGPFGLNFGPGPVGPFWPAPFAPHFGPGPLGPFVPGRLGPILGLALAIVKKLNCSCHAMAGQFQPRHVMGSSFELAQVSVKPIFGSRAKVQLTVQVSASDASLGV